MFRRIIPLVMGAMFLYNVANAQYLSDEQFKRIDLNGDGKVTEQEYLGFIGSKLLYNKEDFLKRFALQLSGCQFKHLDEDGDESLSLEDLSYWAKRGTEAMVPVEGSSFEKCIEDTFNAFSPSKGKLK